MLGLQQWLEANSLSGEIISQILTLNNQRFYIFEPQEGEKVFNERFEFDLDPAFVEALESDQITQIVFPFGSRWYYSDILKPRLNILKYIGDSLIKAQNIDFPYLGVHGKFDISNGSRDYADWCKKAQFLGISTLGICEVDTLAGVLVFQQACEQYKIKSILGETVTVKTDKEELYKVKLFCKNEEGWQSLLQINAQIKVFNEGFVEEKYLLTNSKALICVLDPNYPIPIALSSFKATFLDDLYYQFDSVEWSNEVKDQSYLDVLKQYVNGIGVRPILLLDSYYLDKEEGHIKKVLNTVGKVGFQNQSFNQYFKSIIDIIEETDNLFKDEHRSSDFINQALENTIQLGDKCDFKIKLGELRLPQYELTEEEKQQFEQPIDLFWHAIQQGLDEKVIGKVEDEEIYLNRVQEEVRVIEKGGFVDYFLILYDVMNWCRKNDIITGIGRGSAAGSLVSYLLDITKVDPLKYNLLFERFLNEGRLKKGLPDIDCDFPSHRRDDVKRYIESRYGADRVASIGTYGTFKIKAGIKDLGKYYGADFAKTNYITSFIPDDADSTSLFKMATETPVLKDFIQSYPSVIEDFDLIAYQQRTVSVHAAGVVIVPKNYQGREVNIYNWMPVKKMDGVLVTEWEGPQLDAAGFLKNDILGISQLQKFDEIIKLIEKNTKKKISIHDMDLENPTVYSLFQQGYNEDVFQFGAAGLKNYCQELKPTNIDDLIATVALYRPGPIENNIHKSYAKIKNGHGVAKYDHPLLEPITANSHGLLIFQEQIMRVCTDLAGFTLVQADDIRKGMGKKDVEKMQEYRTQFIEGAKKNDCSELKATQIWNQMELFAGYAFNRSHAAAYALTGYFSQWLKHEYPLEFWTISLHHSKSEEIGKRIAEIHKISDVKILPPDINNSVENFKVDYEEKTIYWSISSIKFAGETAIKAIMKEREEKGKFFSFKDFYSRIQGKSVNKRVITNLILSGCFDQIEKLKSPSDRFSLIKTFIVDLLDSELSEEFTDPDQISKNHFWVLKQKELTGFGYLDFEKIFKTQFTSSRNDLYLDSSLLESDIYLGKQVNCIGILTEVVERKSKKGPFAQLFINCNDENVLVIVWSEIWQDLKKSIVENKNKVISITGEVKFDNYRGYNIIQTNLKTKFQAL